MNKYADISTESLAAYKIVYQNLHYDQKLKDNQEGIVHYIENVPMFFAVRIENNQIIAYPPPILTPKN